MGSEDIDIQCHQQPTIISDPCNSTIGVATVPYSIGDPQQMSVPLTQGNVATSVGTAILAHSAASHTPPQNVAVQPSVPASPLPHVQVIQQPLQSQYLQHLYAPQQQHMFLPSNLTLQPAIQGIAGAQGLSLQLQGKPMDNKGGAPTLISASPMQSGGFSASNLIPAGSQMITAGAKTCVQGQMLTASSKSTAVIQGQSAFIPSTTANQTVVIGQLGVLANQPSLIQHQTKAMSDSQKNKSFLISQPATLHPKSPILPSPGVQCGAGQMMAGNHFKQIQSAPHIISSQAPTMIASQAQILGSLQALGASLPQGITWATPSGSLHSPALFGQNPIFIRSQQSDMFIQTPPPQATLHAVPMQTAPPTPAPQPVVTSVPTSTHVHQTIQQPPQPQQIQQQPQIQQQQQQQQIIPQQMQIPMSTQQTVTTKLKQVRPASSVATQTIVSTSTSSSTHVSLTRSQAKQRPRSQQFRSSLALCSTATQHTTAATQTQTNNTSLNHKADAANQTKLLNNDHKLMATHNKSSSTEMSSFHSSDQKPVRTVVMQEVHPTVMSTRVVSNNMGTSTNLAAEAQTNESEETSMDIDEPIQNGVTLSPEQKESENEAINVVAPLADTMIKEPLKQPQKAIVKPHVLTHVIEGFVIQEGSEPFPVSRALQNGITSKPTAERTVTAVSPTVVYPVADVPAVPKKKEKIPKLRGPVELAKCEYCGKMGPKSKFKRSKRFCSTSCAKRYNIGSSNKRHSSSQHSEGEQKSSASGKSGRKKKLGLKKKGWRKSQSKMYNLPEWIPPADVSIGKDNAYSIPEEKVVVKEEENFQSSDVPINVETFESPAEETQMNIPEKEHNIPHHSQEFATKAPVKWTVTDVVDFVRNLPGCSDYADEFRAQEIDGQALLLLKEDHLMSTMSMKLGPALKVCARINTLKDEFH